MEPSHLNNNDFSVPDFSPGAKLGREKIGVHFVPPPLPSGRTVNAKSQQSWVWRNNIGKGKGCCGRCSAYAGKREAGHLLHMVLTVEFPGREATEGGGPAANNRGKDGEKKGKRVKTKVWWASGGRRRKYGVGVWKMSFIPHIPHIPHIPWTFHAPINPSQN